MTHTLDLLVTLPVAVAHAVADTRAALKAEEDHQRLTRVLMALRERARTLA